MNCYRKIYLILKNKAYSKTFTLLNNMLSDLRQVKTMLYSNQIVDIVVPVIEPPCDDHVFHLHRSVVLCDQDVDMFNVYMY